MNRKNPPEIKREISILHYKWITVGAIPYIRN